MPTPDCFIATANDLQRGQITQHQFFKRCLGHIGPGALHHPEDAEPRAVARQCHYRGSFGVVASAIALCLDDPLASSADADHLVNLFMACARDEETVEAEGPVARLSQLPGAQPILRSPLFCQALIAVAIRTSQWSLARELVLDGSPPPPDCNLFTDVLEDCLEDCPAPFWTRLLTAGWVKPSRKMIFNAASRQCGQEGIALFEAIRAAGFDITAEPEGTPPDGGYKAALPGLAKAVGDPAMVQYMEKVFSLPETLHNDDLVSTLVGREHGGIEMIQWMLDRGLDVNWVIQPKTPSNPRERAEMEHAEGISRGSNRFAALHATAAAGNMEAARFLLEKGASPFIKDGKGNTPRDVAEMYNKPEVVQLLDSYMNQ